MQRNALQRVRKYLREAGLTLPFVLRQPGVDASACLPALSGHAPLTPRVRHQLVPVLGALAAGVFRAIDPASALRPCLQCDRRFEPEGAYNRRCPECKRREDAALAGRWG